MFTTLISEDELFIGFDNPEWIIFDVRYDLMDKNAGKDAYLQGHIPGAIYVDNGGSFAARLWWMLRYMQHKNVAVLDGGWQSWLTVDRPISRDVVARVSSEFKNSALASSVIDIEDVDKFERVIDSRDPARYRGDIEPIDKVAGHIPGATNRFWKENLTEAGIFKSKQKLKQEFDELFGNTRSENTVFYCGSGVTACHNLLATAHAGLNLPKLYAGSWSEWSSTPGKPVATEM